MSQNWNYKGLKMYNNLYIFIFIAIPSFIIKLMRYAPEKENDKGK